MFPKRAQQRPKRTVQKSRKRFSRCYEGKKEAVVGTATKCKRRPKSKTRPKGLSTSDKEKTKEATSSGGLARKRDEEGQPGRGKTRASNVQSAREGRGAEKCTRKEGVGPTGRTRGQGLVSKNKQQEHGLEVLKNEMRQRHTALTGDAARSRN